MKTIAMPRVRAVLFAYGLLSSIALFGCQALSGDGRQNCVDCVEAAVSSDSEDAALSFIPLREKLGAQLIGLVESYRNNGFESALAYAKSSSLDLREDRVSVHVVATSEQDVSNLEQRIKDVGGSVESKFENSIFATMPVAELGVFAASEAVWRMDAQPALFAPSAKREPPAEPLQEAKQGDDR